MKRLLDFLCGLLAALALFAIMALTLVDVVGRKLFDHSLTGSLELTEILMVVVIFAALPLVSLHGEHVVFDSLDHLMPPWLRRLQQALVDLACAVALGALAWLMWDKARQMAGYGDTTAQLQLPMGPFVGLMAVLCGLTALVHLLLMLQPAAQHPLGVPEPARPGAGAASGTGASS
ncbi:MAG: TRAP transporter small permease [Microbacteriaceae bacterium]|nr:TRAP transporter small permease [Burkholderiaceae bacterium]